MNACGPSRIRSWIGGRWWEGANGGGIKAPSKPFSKLLQKSRVLLQAFPKKSLTVLWDFKGLQDFQVIGAKVRAEVVWRWVVVAANRKLRGGDSRIGDCLNLWGNAAAAGHRRAFACRAEELGVGAFGRARGISPNDRGATRRDRAAERRPWAAGHQGQRQAADPAERHGKGERDAAGGPVWRAPAARPHAYKADHP